MLPATSPRRKPKSPGVDPTLNVNPKTSVTCTNVPESLFDATTAKKHFSKFGRVQKIRLFPKRLMCIIEYDQPLSAERAVLNAGAFDGFMFDVTRSKARIRKKSKREEDPDWVPDSDVEEELSAMSGAPSYRMTRQTPMDVETNKAKPKSFTRVVQQSPVRKRASIQKKTPVVSQITTGIESPVPIVTTQTTLSTIEAAAELHQLRSKVSLTPDEQWRVLDARDRILRGWGGAGSRVQIGGATIGTCQDMCPEKELLHRQAEHQVMTLETMVDSDGLLEPWRAVKQYSRSSADQEIPMCYELRPAPVLMRTCSYLLHEIADTTRQVTLADWFHFMWDRFRGIRKDITQQALCCTESIRLVEMCARFHAHCAARLADLEHTQFDQKLNTDNLTKCLQTLKHMYADVTADKRPNEAEFRGYIALLNLGDANFWWEIKQLPHEMQKSEPILFAIQIFNAIDNNNYVKFFRLVKQKATYLQACILLRYFNDVRARALARIVKAYAPRGGSRFPAADLMNALAFESIEKMKAFINHYGLRFGRIEEHELSIILSRHQFIEDSDPFPIARAIKLIESKRQCTVGEVIAGGLKPNPNYSNHVLHSSFTKDGQLKESALIAEEQGYNTTNDSNKDVKALKAEIQRLAQGGKSYNATNIKEIKANPFAKPDVKAFSPKHKAQTMPTIANIGPDNHFSFNPAITLEPTDVTKYSPEKIFDGNINNTFSFSKPQETSSFNKNAMNIFSQTTKNLFENNLNSAPKKLFDNKAELNFKSTSQTMVSKNIFQNTEVMSFPENNENKSAKSVFGNNSSGPTNPFESKEAPSFKSLFNNNTQESKDLFDNKTTSNPKSLFGNAIQKSDPKELFGQINEKNDVFKSAQSVFNSTKSKPSLFSKPNITKSIFEQNVDTPGKDLSSNIFSKNPPTNLNNYVESKNIFAVAKESSVFEKPGTTAKIDSSSLFSKAIQENREPKEPQNIFTSFNKTSDNKNIFAKPDINAQKSVFAPNGEATVGNVSPGAFFKNVLNPPNGSDSAKSYSIFQSKNKAQTVADNILNSVNANAHSVYEFDQNEEEKQRQLEIQRQNEEKIREAQKILQQEEEKRQQELRKQEEIRQTELRRQEELKKQEMRRKEEELRLLKEKEKKEEQRKQEELRRLEEEKKAELKRLAEERERKFKQAVDEESTQLVEDLINEINNETCSEMTKEAQEQLKILMKYVGDTTEEIVTQLCDEICKSEMKAETFLTFNLMKKWFYVWRRQLLKNIKRRTLLEDTPVWLPDRTPLEEASYLRRSVEDSALQNMYNFHRGYKFSGELKQLPAPQPYNIMELIRSPLLKRMKQISYPYDKCFYWKVTLVAPGEDKWLYKKINVQKWLMEAFSDKKTHEESETLIHVGKESWNHLMEFAISVSLISKEEIGNSAEAIEGSNGVLVYSTEKDNNLKESIEYILKQKYQYQIVPVAIIMPKTDTPSCTEIQSLLNSYVQNKTISAFKMFLLDSSNINELLNESTKKAVKWLAKKYPPTPPLEIDLLKSICERYLGNEIWCRFKMERDGRMREVLKNIYKLIECYNSAVDRLTAVITDEDLFNYTNFPLEFKPYLDYTSPYPKPYEFITSNVRTSENISTISDIMKQLKLPNPSTGFNPLSVQGMQQQIRKYCNQIGWFEEPEHVVCKVVAVMPTELTDLNMSQENFTKYFSHYDLIDFLNIIVYEKINQLNRFDNRYAIYKPSVLHEYCNIDWIYEVEAVVKTKHKAIEYEDEIDDFIKAKRRKIEMDSLEYLMLEDKDSILVDESIMETDANISKYSNCTQAVKQLEKEIDEGKKKSVEFELMLRAALADV